MGAPAMSSERARQRRRKQTKGHREQLDREGFQPHPSAASLPPHSPARNWHGWSCLPKLRIWGLLPSFCLSVGSEHRAGHGMAEVKDLSWKIGKNPKNPIAGSCERLVLLHPPAPVPGRNWCPFPAIQGELPAPFPAPCRAFPSANAAGTSGRSSALPQLNYHTWIRRNPTLIPRVLLGTSQSTR